MENEHRSRKTIIKDLGAGLILRHATPDDADALADFNAAMHGDDEQDGMRVAAWTRDLLTRPHPTLRPDAFTVIEETASGRIISSLNLIPQTWAYEDVEFGVGRPELVGTLPEFRGKGLVRAQFDEIHKWCVERELPVQAITGIPYFYRQFGYEMALDFVGRRYGYEANVPILKDDEEEKYLVRPAVEADLPFIAEVYAQAIQRHAIKCIRTSEIFKYELKGQSEDNVNHFETLVISGRSGESLGYLQHSSFLGLTGLTAVWYELKKGISWLDVTPAVIRYLWNKGQEYAKRDGKKCTTFGIMGGTDHPVYQALGKEMPLIHEPYALQMRVPDLPGFLNHIKSALEKRLEQSIAVGHSREIKVGFYRDGLCILIEKGKLVSIGKWMPSPGNGGDIAFPDRTFLQLLFGYRSYDEMHTAFADCWCDHEDVRVLINILFPKKLSDVYPVA